MRLLFLVFVAIFSQNIIAKIYEVPPSKSTHSNVPWIPDKEMEYCVKIYNEAKWLNNAIDSIQVNSYSQASVNTYNDKIRKHAEMINYFNKNCAGKQSKSAYEAAKKLNQEVR